MRKRWVVLGGLLLALMMLSATVVLAGDPGQVKQVYIDEVGWVSKFDDGRINAFDIAAPVAIFYGKTTVPAYDEDGMRLWTEDGPGYEDVFTHFEVWGINPATEAWELLMCCPEDAINMAQAATGDSLVMEKLGYQLWYSQTGWFWVIDLNSGYTFAWEA